MAGALLALAAGVTAGFMRIKGLSSERYLFHRLRFARRRQGLGVWQVAEGARFQVQIEPQKVLKKERAPSKPVSAWAKASTHRPTPPRATAPAGWRECTVETSPFGLGFYLAALSAMESVIVYVALGTIP